MLFALPATAGLSDVQVRQNNDITTVEVTFSERLRLKPSTIQGSLKEFVLPLELLDTKELSAWSSSQLDIDESHHGVTQVILEGDSKQGMSLTIRLRDTAHVEVLPQYMNNHVLFSISSPKTHRRLSASSKEVAGKYFTLTLDSRRSTALDIEDVPKQLARANTVYIIPFEKAGESWQRLRVGFWTEESEAVAARAQIVKNYPEAWIDKVDDREVAYANAYRINPRLALESTKVIDREEDHPEKRDATIKFSAVTPSSIQQLDEPAPQTPRTWQAPQQIVNPLLEEADNAFKREEYAKAIPLYTKLSTHSDGEIHQLAFERLGISRELNGQRAHAVKLYREYLAQYPQTAGAARVRQRLDVMTAISADLPATLRKVSRSTSGWRSVASLSQFYRRHSLEVEGIESVPIDGVFTDVNLTTRNSGGAYENEARISLSHLYDLTDELDGKDFQISSAYWETFSNSLSSAIKVGRQSKYDAGVIGRFDGAVLSHRLSDQIELGVVGGFVLNSSFDSPNSERPFYGGYGQYRSKSGNFKISPFVIQQEYEGVIDRQAVGFQTQWVHGSNLVTGLLDYDFHHQALNNVTLATTIGIGKSSSFNFSIDQRRSPYVTTRNALIGQPYDELNDLERELIDLSLKELADDRAATSRSLRLGWNKKISNRWELTSDVLVSDMSDTESSMNVAGFESRQDLYYSMQLRALEIFGKSSYSGLMLRQADSNDSSTQSVYWSNRISIGRQWFLYPRLRFDHRKFDVGNQTQQSTKPSIRLDYRLTNRVRFQFETGYELTTREVSTDEINMSGFFISAGYRATF